MSTDKQRIREIADSLDALPDFDLELLAGITPATAEAWRKRGTGPAYILVGNRYYYPRKSLKEFLDARVRDSKRVVAL